MPFVRKSYLRSTLLFVYRIAGLLRIAQCHLQGGVTSALHLCLFREMRAWNALHNANCSETITSAIHSCSFKEMQARNALHNATPKEEPPSHYMCVRSQNAGLERTTQCHGQERATSALH